MDVHILECPACHAALEEGASVCTTCGERVATDATAAPVKMPSSLLEGDSAERACPRCGMMVPKQVLRCRDCGSYMDSDVEAAAMAQQANRMIRPGMGTGAFGSPSFNSMGNTSAPLSGFAEVADDDDFDMGSDYGLGTIKLRDLGDDEEDSSSAAADDDDFEADEFVDYGVAGHTEPTPAPTPPAAPVVPPTPAAPPGPVPPAAQVEPPPAAGAGSAPAAPGVSHSVETAGDVLLDAALAEESEASKRSKLGKRRLLKRESVTSLPPDRFLVYCPNGHRVQVQDKHRGRTGRCPNCKALFFVPAAETNQSLGQSGGATVGSPDAATAAEAAPVGYTKWITDVKLHRINPAKLKLVPGSLESEYESVDLGASAENMMLAVLFSGGGPFRAMQEPKKKAATRKAMLDHLAAKKPLDELPVVKKQLLTPDLLAQMKIVQPTMPGEESLFADIPIFGKGRIAVRVAPADTANERAYLSFTLSQFRQLSQILADQYSLGGFGSGTKIPLTDHVVDLTCHYSDTVLKSLAPDGLEYYQCDPSIKLVVLGRRCQKCNLVVSEDSRKKEKIGGATDASIAKALCPKCKAKFGTNTLFGLTPAATPTT
ncbi:MAG: zinc ribbon domain-containing protein [Planctomycetes bacterium]|nr:zinc ribbon domain-containing protein [Planctomycetota bacterium]